MAQQTNRPKATVTLLNIFAPLLLTLFAAWGALELGLRHFYQLIPLPVCASDFILGSYYCQPYFVYDKPLRLAYRYQPGLRLEGCWDPANPYLTDAGPETRPSDRTDAFWYVFQTDEMGFPNSQYTWQERYDIIVTGDSFVTRSAPQTWIELLAAQTGKSILTLGASSWTTLNEVEAVKQFGLDKKPQWVVLLYFSGNDLINAQHYLDKQASGLDWREYDMQGVPWYRRLVTYHLARYALQSSRSAVADAAPRYRYPVTVTTDWGPLETVFKDIHLLPMSASYETVAASDEFAAITRALRELHELTAVQNAHLLLVYVPSKEEVYWPRLWDDVDVNNVLERSVTVTLSQGDHGRLQWTPRYISYDTMSANYDAQARLLAEFAAAHQIDFLDLTSALREKTIREGEFYHYADPHWNQAGNQLVADLIQAYMRQR